MSDPVDMLLQQLATAAARRDKASERRDRCLADHRASNDGIAESIRAIETAPTLEERRRLTRLHLAAETAALGEYTRRRQRWGDDVTGALRALPCGPNRALTGLLIEHRIMGSYRYHPDNTTAPRTVTLLREVPEPAAVTRLRRRFRVPAQQPLDSLADALAVVADRHPDRLVALAGPATADAIIAALDTAAANNTT